MLLIRLNGTLAPVWTVNSAGVGAASWADSRPATAKVVASSGRIDIQNTPTFLAPRPRKDVPLYVGQAGSLMPLVFPVLGACINRGAVPLDRGRRPRRPARTLQDADPICSRCGTKASRADQGVCPTASAALPKVEKRVALAWQPAPHRWHTPFCSTVNIGWSLVPGLPGRIRPVFVVCHKTVKHPNGGMDLATGTLNVIPKNAGLK